MTLDELHESLSNERARLAKTLERMDDLRVTIGVRDPTDHEVVSLAGRVHDLYGGIESMLRRVAKFYDVSVPVGENWHRGLLELFSSEAIAPLLVLFSEQLMERVDEYHGFRHVFRSRYSDELDWAKLEPLVLGAASLIDDVCSSIALTTKWRSG